MLFSKEKVYSVSITTPNQTELTIDVINPQFNDNKASCSIEKDSGDDPDITNGTLVSSEVRLIPDSSEIVIDDTLYLTAGDILNVDGVVLKSDMCEVDESVITGESNSIKKSINDNVVSGSIVTMGSMYIKVTNINDNTYANTIVKEASNLKENTSYLKKNISNILKVVTILKENSRDGLTILCPSTLFV